ncbi:MAG: hypothetical protein WBA17_06325 [Saprospiraceae bacterium]
MIQDFRPIDRVVDFLTSTPSPREVLDYMPSKQDVQRFELLADKKREGNLSQGEVEELETFLLVEHMMNVAKRRAHQRQRAV